MRAEEYLRLVSELPIVTWDEVTGGMPFVVLAPHADDETLGAGGLIAAACDAGQTVGVIIVTDGSGSHPHSVLYPPDRLIKLRHDEARHAIAELGLAPSGLTHLDLRDTAVPMRGSAFDRAVEQVARIVEMTGAKTLFVTWRHDPHCDHEATELIARAVRSSVGSLAIFAYPIWGWHLAPDIEVDEGPPAGARIDISRWRHCKEAAIVAYRSQMTAMIEDDPTGFHFTAQTLAPFLRPFEYFIRIAQ